MDKASYALGLGIGHQLKGMGGSKLNIDDFAQAIKDIIQGKEPQMSMKEAQIVANTFIQEAEKENKKLKEEAGAKFKAYGEQYLAENAKKDGVKVTKSGLQYEVLNEGTGKSPKATDNVKCHYEGRLIDGTVFDSSYRRGTPATFPLNGVIGTAANERRRQIPLPYSLQPGLRCKRCRRKHSSILSLGV